MPPGLGDGSQNGSGFGMVEKHGGGSSAAFAPALAQPLIFSLPATQQPGGASQASIGGCLPRNHSAKQFVTKYRPTRDKLRDQPTKASSRRI
jgi:hypothetical protein